MHERSLVTALLSQVADVARGEGVGVVREVCVEVGPLSGVEALLINSAFRELAVGTVAAHATLRIVEVSLTARCLDCGEDVPVEDFRFRCSACGSPQLRVTSGDGVRLLSISLEEEWTTA